MELCGELFGAVHRETEKKTDKFITRPSSSKLMPVNTNPQIDKSDDESDSEATATVSKRQNCSDNASQAKSRKYEDSYLHYDFVVCPASRGTPQPQCMFCSQVLSNECMKPSKLIRHLHMKHDHSKDKPRVFFERSRTQAEMKSTNADAVDKKLVKISYIVAQKIIQQKKSHTIRETLIMPCVTEIVSEMYGE